MRLGAPHFGIAHVERRLPQTVERDRQQFGDIPSTRRGIEAENPCVRIPPMKGMDGIGESTRLAHFLEQARGHPPANCAGENLHRIEILMRVTYAFEADRNVRLLEPAPQARVTALVARGRGLGFDALRREPSEASLGRVANRSVIDRPGRPDHRRASTVMSIEIGANFIPAEARHLFPRAKDWTPNRLIWKSGRVQQFKDEIIRRVFNGSYLLQNDAFFALELDTVEGAFGQNISEDIERERNVAGQNMRVVGGMFRACRGVEIAARRLDFLGDITGRAPPRSLERHMFEKMRQAMLVRSFVAGPGADKNAKRGSFKMRHALGGDPKARR